MDKNINILIIDDDFPICKSISRIMEKKGYIPYIASTLKEGLEFIKSKLFDVIFLDVKLPDGDGLDYIKEIRETSPNTEVVIITGYEIENGPKVAFAHGAYDYIVKPFFINDIALPRFSYSSTQRRLVSCSKI